MGGLDAAQQPIVEVRPTALYQQPDGRRNLVRIVVAGLRAPAARARITDRRGALMGTAGLLPLGGGPTLTGEVWVPLPGAAEFRVDVEVGRERVARRRVRLTPPRRWTVYWVPCVHTEVGGTHLQEVALEHHRKNLDTFLSRTASHPEERFSAECALAVLTYLENRSPEAGAALVDAIHRGKVGFAALFANMLNGLLDHETYARLVWPAGRVARAQGLTFAAAQVADVPGQPVTFPTLLAASGVRYLLTAVNPERALPLMSRRDADSAGAGAGLAGDWMSYPQLYYWEGPDGGRVLHWRTHERDNAAAFGFGAPGGTADDIGRRLSDWLLGHPVFLARDWPSDIVLLHGGAEYPNEVVSEEMFAQLAEYRRRFAFPRIVPARLEDLFRELERRYGPRIPVRRGDTGLYREDGAASTAAELALFRSAQLLARAAEIVALWDDRLASADEDPDARRRSAAERAAMWRDLLLFGEHTWGSDASVAEPASRDTVAQWAYKRRYIEAGAAAARALLGEGLLRLGRATEAGRGRLIFNAGSWPRTDVARVPGGAGKALLTEGRELPAVDLPDGDALVLVRDVAALGYLAVQERDREPRPPIADGDALEAAAGGLTVKLDPATGAIQSLTGPDGKERVKPSPWSGLNQLVYARGGEQGALWTSPDPQHLATPPELAVTQARLLRARRERLPGIGVRLVLERALEGRGFSRLESTVTLYDELPWVDLENRVVKNATERKEALYVAFPFAFAQPTVEVEVPLGRMTVERDQQPGSCRDWYCHTHWVWLREGADGVLWSGPDTPLLTLNDLVRGQWRRTIAPDGTLFAYAMHNYWYRQFAAAQGGGEPVGMRFRLSLLAPGDAAEPARRGWAACDSLAVSAAYDNAARGALLPRDRAFFLADRDAMVIGAKPADDGEGAIVKLLDVTGAARDVGVWPAAFTFRAARRTDLVERNGESIAVAGDGKAAVKLAAWGAAALRLFTPAE
ncbi:MAG: hypothetical protein ACREMN_05395 [Gemmatimonadales bacterium]